MTQHLRSIAHNAEIRELHHRAMRIGVDRDDVSWVTESGSVLNRTRNTPGQIQVRIHDHSGGADLSIVMNPATIGDHAGGTHGRTKAVSNSAEQVKILCCSETSPTAHDAWSFGQIHRGYVRFMHLLHDGISGWCGEGNGRRDVRLAEGHRELMGLRAAHPHLQRGYHGLIYFKPVKFGTEIAGHRNLLGADL